MKKLISLLMCIVLLGMCFVACNQTEEPVVTESDTEVETKKDESDTKAPDNDKKKDEGKKDEEGDGEGEGEGGEEQLPNVKYILWSEDFESYDNLIDATTKVSKGKTSEADLLAAMGMSVTFKNDNGDVFQYFDRTEGAPEGGMTYHEYGKYILETDANGNNSMLVYNNGYAQDQLIMFSDSIMDKVVLGKYVIEYDITYAKHNTPIGNTGLSRGNRNTGEPGYIGVMYNLDENIGASNDPTAAKTAGSAGIFTGGSGQSVVWVQGSKTLVEAENGDGVVNTMRNGGGIEGFASVFAKLFPNDTEFKDVKGYNRTAMSNAADYTAEDGTVVPKYKYQDSFAGKTVRIRIEYDYENGVTVYANNILVSEFSASKLTWAQFLATAGSSIGLYSTDRVAGYVDNFEVYCIGRIGAADDKISDADIASCFTKVDDTTYKYTKGSYGAAA